MQGHSARRQARADGVWRGANRFFGGHRAGSKISVTFGKLSKIHLQRYQRWGVELDLRDIKTTLGMEHLRCRTPEMVFKELWVYMLAYNLIRLLMAQAALLADQIPRQLSFEHTVQVCIAWQQRGRGTPDAVCIRGLLILIAGPRVGRRPGRIEPRALKRRATKYPLMTQAWVVAREQVRLNGHPKK